MFNQVSPQAKPVVSRKVLAVTGGVVLLAAVVAGVYVYTLGTDFQQPTVESMESEFGNVTNETALVHSRVVVDNPNNESLPASATINYQVRMNSVTVANGRKPGIQLQPGRNVVNLTAEFDNSKIPAWWVTHINNDSYTTVTTTGRVSLAGLPLGTKLPPQNQTVETDLLGPLANESDQEVVVANQSILLVTNHRAAWGKATAERTPVRFSVDLENTHDRPVTLDGTAYEVRMNGVVVGEGTTADSIRLDPGESGTFTSNAAIDTPKMQRWWVTHLRNDQATHLEVEVFAVVEDDGEREHVPLAVYDTRARFESDLLGTGNTSVEVLPPEPREEFAEPEVVETGSEWGEVTDETTEVVTHATVHNPNSGAFGDVLELRVNETTTINGVKVTDGTGTLDGLEPGNNTLTVTGTMDHDTVPRWWARHVNNGERSTVETTTTGTVDIGVTTLDVNPPDRTNTQETDVLRNLDSDEDQEIQRDGRTIATIRQTRAEWGEATPERAPVTVDVTIENEQLSTMTIRDIDYLVQLNDVTLADDRIDESYTIAPLSTETIELTLVLNNSKMAAWWPTHVRNGERSTLHTETEATVEVGGRSERVTFDALGGNTTVRTDLLDQE